MRRAPAAVAVLAAASGAERTGLAVTAWSSVSADPPTLLACVNERASAFSAIQSAGAFSLNLLATGDEETAAIFSAQRGLAGGERFLKGAWRTAALGQPVLVGAVASFVCELAAVHRQTTHGVFIGAVVDIHLPEGRPPALLYLDGRFTRTCD
jgi:flavin reductase